MRKEDLSKIAKRGIEIAKTCEGAWVARVALGMKQAWEEFKASKNELPQLQGSEKQVAWALKLREEKIQHINEMLGKFTRLINKGFAVKTNTAKTIEFQTKLVEAKTQTSAVYFINNR